MSSCQDVDGRGKLNTYHLCNMKKKKKPLKKTLTIERMVWNSSPYLDVCTFMEVSNFGWANM